MLLVPRPHALHLSLHLGEAGLELMLHRPQLTRLLFLSTGSEVSRYIVSGRMLSSWKQTKNSSSDIEGDNHCYLLWYFMSSSFLSICNRLSTSKHFLRKEPASTCVSMVSFSFCSPMHRSLCVAWREVFCYIVLINKGCKRVVRLLAQVACELE